MMGTAPNAVWPAPAKNESDKPGAPAKSKTMSRITMALLDEYSEAKGRGYNPYDSPKAPRNDDVWKRKPKRD